ncbi:PREDICTED: uncharacterized protein LOC108379310 [Rhagoletis zephyria]|uniref:uncharacterized protein LOC108379310 n=1 Tax=Rhagoletis zephyria TaxID=28612 RepID=UPI0008117544|nr:PREDICTED: uncharacterized protein LOC108379310 [Rhagoletis zephyria]
MPKPILVLLGAILIQIAFGLPSTLPKGSDENLYKEHNVIPKEKDAVTGKSAASIERKRLSAMIKEGDAKHFKFLLEGSNKIAKDLLADARINGADHRRYAREEAMLEQYVKDSDKALSSNSSKCKTRVLKDFFTFTNHYTSDKENHTSENDIIIREALKAHGYDQLEAEEYKLLDEIGSHYAYEFEKYLMSLLPAERENEEDLMNVYETQYVE